MESPRGPDPAGQPSRDPDAAYDRAPGGLEDSAALSRALFHFCNEGILLTTPDGGVQAANPEACRILQASEAEICAGGRGSFVDPADTRLPGYLAQRNETGSVRGLLTMKRGDGSPFPAEFGSAVFLDGLGNRRTVTVFRDISDRRGLEEKTAWLAAIVESTDDAVIGKDLEGVITSWNSGAARLYGFGPEEMIGQPISSLAPPGREHEWARIVDLIGRGERVPEFDTIRLTKDGRTIPVSIRASPVRSRDGKVIGASTTARDISERLRAQAERERMIEELRQALAEVRTLSGLVPICAQCKKIRDDQGFWTQVETQRPFQNGRGPCAGRRASQARSAREAPSPRAGGEWEARMRAVRWRGDAGHRPTSATPHGDARRPAPGGLNPAGRPAASRPLNDVPHRPSGPSLRCIPAGLNMAPSHSEMASFIQARSAATFTHGLCPDCARDFFPDFAPPPGEG